MNSSAIYITFCYILSDVHVVILKFPSHFAFVNHLIACAFNSILTITTVALNSGILVTFLRAPRLRRNVSLFLIMLLSCVDIGVGLIANSFFAVDLASEIAGTTACWVYVVRDRASILFTNLSLLTVTAINIERYIGVVYPMIHRAKVTTGKLLKFVILSWSSCGVMIALSFYSHRPLTIYSGIVKLAFVVFTAIVYGKIALIVLSVKTQNKSPNLNLESNSNHVSETETPPSIERRMGKLRFLLQLKLSKPCFYIVICYLICYSPIAILLGALRESFEGYNLVLARIWCITLAMVNSSVNSVIFFWCSRELRTAVKLVFKPPRR